jgi:hypothetical protein
MFCRRCGNENLSDAAVCSKCGAPLGSRLDPAVVVKRPALITLLAVVQLGGGLLMLVLAAIIFLTSGVAHQPDAGFAMGIAVAYLIAAVLNIACGIGLWTLRPYGRTLQIVLAAISLLGVPVGTVIGGLILYYMYRPGIRALFSGKPADGLSDAELAEIAAVTQRSSAAVVFIAIVVILGGVVVLGIAAAIAVPSLLRARMSGNEASGIGSLRTVVSAQAAYAAAGSGGYATRLATLAAPCPGMTLGFISPELAHDPSVKSGYTISMERAGEGSGPVDCNGVETGTDFYATAVPVKFNETGSRAFATSAAGAIYQGPDGRLPSVSATLDGTAIPVRSP